MSRAWKRQDAFHWRCAPWDVALTIVMGKEIYSLFKDGTPQAVFRGPSLQSALDRAKELEHE